MIEKSLNMRMRSSHEHLSNFLDFRGGACSRMGASRGQCLHFFTILQVIHDYVILESRYISILTSNFYRINNNKVKSKLYMGYIY